ncbi:MAG: UDP-N-acetylmuramate:L-alanyl-gamma-D-glutamyl-meso-diaminopimelate ligase, partial [Gammaproteobacteria bacterium]|nr:UDP-N-acetylmuramate:L-alanyl-gamma-D-glutamyl-meso-diaminopimelate ligase [Gammaproteobacteria bacterium]
AAASHAGVPLQTSVAALGCWRGVRRRLEQVGVRREITIYDDFAHHPTEISATLQALRSQKSDGRIVAVFEPRSNSMKLGVHASELGKALSAADRVFVFEPSGLQWDIQSAFKANKSAVVLSELSELSQAIVNQLQAGDRVVVMSNGSFGGLPARLLDALQ